MQHEFADLPCSSFYYFQHFFFFCFMYLATLGSCFVFVFLLPGPFEFDVKSHIHKVFAPLSFFYSLYYIDQFVFLLFTSFCFILYINLSSSNLVSKSCRKIFSNHRDTVKNMEWGVKMAAPFIKSPQTY